MKQILHSIIALSFWLSLAGVHSVALAHEGHHNQAPAKACHEKTVGDDCQYSDDHQTILYVGTCQSMSEQNMCVRNQPLIYLKALPSEPSVNQETEDLNMNQGKG